MASRWAYHKAIRGYVIWSSDLYFCPAVSAVFSWWKPTQTLCQSIWRPLLSQDFRGEIFVVVGERPLSYTRSLRWAFDQFLKREYWAGVFLNRHPNLEIWEIRKKWKDQLVSLTLTRFSQEITFKIWTPFLQGYSKCGIQYTLPNKKSKLRERLEEVEDLLQHYPVACIACLSSSIIQVLTADTYYTLLYTHCWHLLYRYRA